MFLGTHTPHAPLTGEVVRGTQDLSATARERLQTGSANVDIRCDRFSAQTWQTIRNLETTLAEAQTPLDRLVLLRVVLKRREDVPTFLRIAATCLGSWLPACDIVIASDHAADPNISLWIDGIASTSPAQPETVRVPTLESLLAPFPTAVKAGPFLFTSTLPGFDPHTRESMRTMERLDPADRALVEALRPSDSEIEQFFVDQVTMWRNLRRVLDHVGMSLADVVYHASWLTRSMQYLAFGSAPRLMTSEFREFCLTCFSTSKIAYPGTQWTGRLVACIPESAATKAVRVPLHPLSGAYHGLVQVGPIILSSGEVPIDVSRRLLIDRPSRLPEDLRALSNGQVFRTTSAPSQVSQIFRLLGDGLRRHGLDFSAVAHQTLYLTDLSDTPSVMLIAHKVYGGRVPPTSVIPVDCATAYDDARAEIEVFAIADSASGDARAAVSEGASSTGPLSG